MYISPCQSAQDIRVGQLTWTNRASSTSSFLKTNSFCCRMSPDEWEPTQPNLWEVLGQCHPLSSAGTVPSSLHRDFSHRHCFQHLSLTSLSMSILCSSNLFLLELSHSVWVKVSFPEERTATSAPRANGHTIGQLQYRMASKWYLPLLSYPQSVQHVDKSLSQEVNFHSAKGCTISSHLSPQPWKRKNCRWLIHTPPRGQIKKLKSNRILTEYDHTW